MVQNEQFTILYHDNLAFLFVFSSAKKEAAREKKKLTSFQYHKKLVFPVLICTH